MTPQWSNMKEVALDLSDDVILVLAKEAHRQDITLNQLMVNTLTAKIGEERTKVGEEKDKKCETYRHRLKVSLLILERRSLPRLRYLIEQPNLDPNEIEDHLAVMENTFRTMRRPLAQLRVEEDTGDQSKQ